MKLIILSLLCLTMVACSKGETSYSKQIDIDFSQKQETTFAYSQFFENVKYIQLDDTCLVGQIDEIRQFGETIYIANKMDGCVHQYDMSGRYLSSLRNRGHARNEYVVMDDFDVSPQNGDIHVYDGGSKRFLVYSKDGVFRRSFHTDYVIRDFAVLSNGDYLLYTPDKNVKAKRGLWQTDSLGNFRKQLISIDDDFRYGGLYPQYLTHIDSKYVGLMGGEDANNFYLVSEDSLYIQLHVNYNISIPYEIQKEENFDSEKYRGKAYTKNNYIESHRWLSFSSTNFDKNVLCFYDKVNEICYKVTEEENLIMDIEVWGSPLSIYDDTWISVTDAYSALNIPKLKAQFPNITETSNPILGIAKILR